MKNRMQQTEIENVFAAFNLPLIDRSIDEIQEAKDQLNPASSHTQVGRCIFSSGTGNSSIINHNAKLERNPI